MSRDFSARANGRPFSAKTRRPVGSDATIPPHDEQPSFQPLQPKQLTFAPPLQSSGAKQLEMKIRIAREYMSAGYRARMAAEENKKTLEDKCKELQRDLVRDQQHGPSSAREFGSNRVSLPSYGVPDTVFSSTAAVPSRPQSAYSMRSLRIDSHNLAGLPNPSDNRGGRQTPRARPISAGVRVVDTASEPPPIKSESMRLGRPGFDARRDIFEFAKISTAACKDETGPTDDEQAKQPDALTVLQKRRCRVPTGDGLLTLIDASARERPMLNMMVNALKPFDDSTGILHMLQLRREKKNAAATASENDLLHRNDSGMRTLAATVSGFAADGSPLRTLRHDGEAFMNGNGQSIVLGTQAPLHGPSSLRQHTEHHASSSRVQGTSNPAHVSAEPIPTTAPLDQTAPDVKHRSDAKSGPLGQQAADRHRRTRPMTAGHVRPARTVPSLQREVPSKTTTGERPDGTTTGTPRKAPETLEESMTLLEDTMRRRQRERNDPNTIASPSSTISCENPSNGGPRERVTERGALAGHVIDSSAWFTNPTTPLSNPLGPILGDGIIQRCISRSGSRPSSAKLTQGDRPSRPASAGVFRASSNLKSGQTITATVPSFYNQPRNDVRVGSGFLLYKGQSH